MRDILDGKESTIKSNGGGSGGGHTGKGGKGNSGEDKETSKMKEALGDAIVTDKPNVHWDDIAGLINAKKAL